MSLWYEREFAIEYRDECMFLYIDDKHKIKVHVGELGSIFFHHPWNCYSTTFDSHTNDLHTFLSQK